MLKALRFITLVLAALSMTMESAHLLELPQKMQYDSAMYTAVNGSLYRYFAIVGGTYQLLSIVAAVVLAFVVRRRGQATFRWTIAGAACLVAAFVIWLAVVAPVNSDVSGALAANPDSVPALWMQLRGRWEYGHVAGFVVQLMGLCALVMSMLVETPDITQGRME